MAQLLLSQPPSTYNKKEKDMVWGAVDLVQIEENWGEALTWWDEVAVPHTKSGGK